MPQVIEVPGYGDVEFPDEMTDDQISVAIQKTMSKDSLKNRAKQILSESKNPIEQYNPVSAIAEPIMKMGTGLVAKPVADVMGLSALVKAKLSGDTDADVSGFRNYIQNALTYEPRTEVGKSPLNPLNAIPNAIGSTVNNLLVDPVANLVGGGSDADTPRGMAGNAVREAIPHALAIAGAKYSTKGSQKANTKLQAIESVKKQKAVDALQKNANVIEAKSDGFSLPPSESGAGVVSRVAEGMVGRDKLIENLTFKNAKNATKMIHDDMGLPSHTPLTQGAVEEVISNAGKTYQKINDLPIKFVSDKKYIGDLTNLAAKAAAKHKNASTWNPEFATIVKDLKKSAIDPAEMVDLMKSLRAESSANFAAAEKGLTSKPNQLALAKFQKEAANALEELAHRNLEKSGMGALSKEFLESRQTIAKGKTVLKVLDENGYINAEKLGRLKERGAYMSGAMDKVARFGRAFPDVATRPKGKWNVPITGLEGAFGVGGIGFAGSGFGLPALAFPASRMAGRAFLESGAGQKMIGMPKTYTPSTLSEAMKAFNQLSPEAQQAIVYGLAAPDK